MASITIDIDDALMARARELAAARKMTVSEMLERLLRVMAQPPLRSDELTPITRAALGMLPPMSDEEVERVLQEERERKYGGA